MKKTVNTILLLILVSFSYPIFSQQKKVVISTNSTDRTVITINPNVDISTLPAEEEITEKTYLAKEKTETKQEIGLVIGGLNGLSYKNYMSENFAIQTDIAVGFQRTIGRVQWWYHFNIFDLVVINPNFLYHKKFKSGIYVETGGGISAGYTDYSDYPDYYGYYYNYGYYKDGHSGLKFGVNFIAGVGYKTKKLPLSFGVDFRPGYALGIPICIGYDIYYNYIGLIHHFDWHLAASIYYCF